MLTAEEARKITEQIKRFPTSRSISSASPHIFCTLFVTEAFTVVACAAVMFYYMLVLRAEWHATLIAIGTTAAIVTGKPFSAGCARAQGDRGLSDDPRARHQELLDRRAGPSSASSATWPSRSKWVAHRPRPRPLHGQPLGHRPRANRPDLRRAAACSNTPSSTPSSTSPSPSAAASAPDDHRPLVRRRPRPDRPDPVPDRALHRELVKSEEAVNRKP